MSDQASPSINPKIVPRNLGFTPAEAISELMEVLGYAATWKTAGFENRNEIRKAEFRDMQSKCELSSVTEKLLMVCLQFGITLPGQAQLIADTLHLIAKTDLGGTLDHQERTCLAAHWVALRPLEFRLRSEEVVLVSDEDPVPYVSGRWAPDAPNAASNAHPLPSVTKPQGKVIAALGRTRGLRMPAADLARSAKVGERTLAGSLGMLQKLITLGLIESINGPGYALTQIGIGLAAQLSAPDSQPPRT